MYHDHAWRSSSLQSPHVWPIWPTVRHYCTGKLLELGSGNLPKIPVKGSYFLEKSESAVTKLNAAGGHAFYPGKRFPPGFFRLACAFEVLEHIPDDKKTIRDIHRVLVKGGILIMSVPVNMKYWTRWDELGGHLRRYNPARLLLCLKRSGFRMIKFSAGGFSNFINRFRFLGDYVSPVITRLWFLSEIRLRFLLPIVNRLDSKQEWHTRGFGKRTANATNLTMVLRKA